MQNIKKKVLQINFTWMHTSNIKDAWRLFDNT